MIVGLFSSGSLVAAERTQAPSPINAIAASMLCYFLQIRMGILNVLSAQLA